MTKPKRTNYVTNAELCEHIKKFKLTCKYDENGKYIPNSGKIREELGSCIVKIARNICTRGCFAGYTWTDDMIGEGILTVCKYLHNCDIEKSSNVFAYMTEIINNAFKIYLKAQKKQSVVKQALFEDAKYNNQTAIKRPSTSTED